ncbi:nicotinate phosphoribosyltransferase-like isoform X1 [Branchiostoma floridae x Branchiostoma belcheri]
MLSGLGYTEKMEMATPPPQTSFNDSNSTHKNNQNGIVQSLLTDLYQVTMAYAYWKSEKRHEIAVFDLFFRKNPFKGEFTLFAGLEECLKYLQNFKFSESDINYLRTILPPSVEEEFYDYLGSLDASEVNLYAVPEGTVVFPRVPLVTVEGPLPVVQLMETTLLNLINYASLVATNAARFRMAAGKKQLLEFGLRRAQGPDGALSASRYCYIGGFDGTSNVLAGKMFDIPVRGTHAHAFVTSYVGLQDLKNRTLAPLDGGPPVDFVSACLDLREEVCKTLDVLHEETKQSELTAFIAYATAFPKGFLALVDTYDVLRSGIPNFCTVALALHQLGYKAIGIRLDSGDLAYLSKAVRHHFRKIADRFEVPSMADFIIVASNDINEDTLHSLNQQGHEIDSFGIGTHLVTCQRQPALGCVFKESESPTFYWVFQLVEVNKQARIKLSQDMDKVTLPGKKSIYRLYSHEGHALIDLMQRPHEQPPGKERRVLCRHPFEESKRAYVSPGSVQLLQKLYWTKGEIQEYLPSLKEIRDRAIQSLATLREDHKRALNPTPYKVAVSADLYQFLHDMWLDNAPIGELS